MTIMLFAASPIVTAKPIAIGIIAAFSLFGSVCGIISAMQQDKKNKIAKFFYSEHQQASKASVILILHPFPYDKGTISG